MIQHREATWHASCIQQTRKDALNKQQEPVGQETAAFPANVLGFLIQQRHKRTWSTKRWRVGTLSSDSAHRSCTEDHVSLY